MSKKNHDQILSLIAGGYSNKEIAKNLSITPQAVKNDVKQIGIKYGLRNRTKLAIMYFKKYPEKLKEVNL